MSVRRWPADELAKTSKGSAKGRQVVSKKRRPATKARQRAFQPAFQIDEHIFFWFGQILGRRNRVLNRELRRFGLDCQRWRVLAVLNEHPGCTMRMLAELTAVNRTTLNPTI